MRGFKCKNKKSENKTWLISEFCFPHSFVIEGDIDVSQRVLFKILINYVRSFWYLQLIALSYILIISHGNHFYGIKTSIKFDSFVQRKRNGIVYMQQAEFQTTHLFKNK